MTTIAKGRTRKELTFDTSLKEKLEELASEENRSLNNYIETVLKEHVNSKNK